MIYYKVDCIFDPSIPVEDFFRKPVVIGINVRKNPKKTKEAITQALMLYIKEKKDIDIEHNEQNDTLLLIQSRRGLIANGRSLDMKTTTEFIIDYEKIDVFKYC